MTGFCILVVGLLVFLVVDLVNTGAGATVLVTTEELDEAETTKKRSKLQSDTGFDTDHRDLGVDVSRRLQSHTVSRPLLERTSDLG